LSNFRDGLLAVAEGAQGAAFDHVLAHGLAQQFDRILLGGDAGLELVELVEVVRPLGIGDGGGEDHEQGGGGRG
jgi:hypothetical protein